MSPILSRLSSGSGGGFGFGRKGGAAPLGAFTATGGTKTTSGSYTLHTFTYPQSGTTFVVSGDPKPIDFLLVGGGGSGGGGCPGATGGGGGGAVIYQTNVPIVPGTYTVTIGQGGAQAPDNGPPGYSGGSSDFYSYTAAGGGHGNTSPSVPSSPRGSGGGGNGASTNNTGSTTSVSTGHPGGTDVVSPPLGWGNPGGNGNPSVGPNNYRAAGGGGAAGQGGGGYPGPALGGEGAVYTISGSSVTYGSGGGGASGYESPNPIGNVGGAGGTGAGAGGRSPGNPGVSGTAASGYGCGGGGAGYVPSNCGVGGAGFPGVCIIRYLT